MQTIRERADELFHDARLAMGPEIKRVEAEMAAKGLLQSGPAISELVKAWSLVTGQALGQALESVSKRVVSRGRDWSKAMDDVQQSLEAHLADAPNVLAKSLGKMAKNGANLSERLLGEVQRKHLSTVNAYRNTWTAPAGKSWIERHPAIYALIFLVLGVVVGKIGDVALDQAKGALLVRGSDTASVEKSTS